MNKIEEELKKVARLERKVHRPWPPYKINNPYDLSRHGGRNK
jgi:hypothetical protein